jgi:hypothetical protein
MYLQKSSIPSWQKGGAAAKQKRAPKQREKLMGLKCESSCIKEKFPVMKLQE